MIIFGKKYPKIVVQVSDTILIKPLAKRVLRVGSSDLEPWGIHKGFEWGFVGAGPLNLARAILAHFISGKVAFQYGHLFAETVVSGFGDDFTISRTRVRQWVTRHINRDRLAYRRASYKARKLLESRHA